MAVLPPPPFLTYVNMCYAYARRWQILFLELYWGCPPPMFYHAGVLHSHRVSVTHVLMLNWFILPWGQVSLCLCSCEVLATGWRLGVPPMLVLGTRYINCQPRHSLYVRRWSQHIYATLDPVTIYTRRPAFHLCLGDKGGKVRKPVRATG